MVTATVRLVSIRRAATPLRRRQREKARVDEPSQETCLKEIGFCFGGSSAESAWPRFLRIFSPGFFKPRTRFFREPGTEVFLCSSHDPFFLRSSSHMRSLDARDRSVVR